MGIRDFAKRAGLIEDDQNEAGSKDSTSIPGPSTSRTPVVPPLSWQGSTTPPVGVSVNSVDSGKYTALLQSAMEKSAVAGFSQFMTQLKVLENVPGMSEAMRFQAAIATLQGIKSADLSRSVEDRLGILTRTRDEFFSTIESRRKQVNQGSVAEQKRTREEIESALRNIEVLKNKLQELEAQGRAEEEKLAAASHAFDGAYAQEEGALRSMLGKISQFLNG